MQKIPGFQGMVAMALSRCHSAKAWGSKFRVAPLAVVRSIAGVRK
jgi:hypothetical protein